MPIPVVLQMVQRLMKPGSVPMKQISFAFGGIIALISLAQKKLKRIKYFMEVVIAPAYSQEEHRYFLQTNLRILEIPMQGLEAWK